MWRRNRSKFVDEEATTKMRVRLGYGSKKQKKKDRERMQANGWTIVEVEGIAGTYIAGESNLHEGMGRYIAWNDNASSLVLTTGRVNSPA
jgi:hypothetical protein